MPPTVYCDEHFGSGDAANLVAQGTHLRLRAELFRHHRHRALDPDQLQFAALQGWIVLTRDRGFTELQDLWYILNRWRPMDPPLHHAGVLWVASNSIANRDVVAHLVTLLTGAPTLQDDLYVLERRGATVDWHLYHPYARRPR